MSTIAYTFTKLVVADLERETAFYRGALGLDLISRVAIDQHDEAVMAVPGKHSGPLLMLMRYVDRPAPAAGSAWIGFAVDDLSAAIAAVEAGGGSVIAPPQDVHEHRLVIAVVADPEGHPIELTAIMH